MMINRIKSIYEKLEDEESKEIFCSRLFYAFTGNKAYMDEMIRKYIMPTGLNEEGAVKYLLDGIENFAENMPLVIYGCGEMGKKIYEYIGERAACFCDRGIEKQKGGFCGKPVISPEHLIENKEKYAVIIGSVDYYKEIYYFLRKNGVWDILDNQQKIASWLELAEKQYFDEEIIQFGENEVFVDGGCLNFGTSKQLLKRCPQVKMIYAFEPDCASAERCRAEAEKTGFKNYCVIEKGLYSKETELHFRGLGNGCSGIAEEGETVIQTGTIDKEIKDRVTFIKMDIEGAELEALKGAEKTICRDHPKLAICIYHKAEDILELPEFILQLDGSYRLYLRHYSDNEGETVLYAV